MIILPFDGESVANFTQLQPWNSVSSFVQAKPEENIGDFSMVRRESLSRCLITLLRV